MKTAITSIGTSANFWFGIITLMPDLLTHFQDQGVIGRAIQRQLATLHFWDPRDYTTDKHRTVDDTSYGGGPGMVMMAEPLIAALKAARRRAPAGTKVVYLSPQGQPFTQAIANKTSQDGSLILLAGRYEGIDERVIQQQVDAEWSIGDYVLSGGELPAMVVMDAVIRLLPGALGDDASATWDSFSDGLLDHPHFTKPRIVDSIGVPKVLLSGNHQSIEDWRLQQSLGRTQERRPDLLQKRRLSKKEQALLADYLKKRSQADATKLKE